MDKILLGHGSGGRLMHQLVREFFAPEFGMKDLSDAAIIKSSGLGLKSHEFKLAFTTDSYVVSPIFFPGGDIGDLAVNGTVNDLSMVGATPLYLSTGFIIEEGFPMDDLRKVLFSMSSAAKKAGVSIIAGDTKVVDKGKGDGIFINTSGIGLVPAGIDLGPEQIRAGDKIIISGLIGNHGISVLAQRNGLTFDPPVISDTAPLNGLVKLMLTPLSPLNKGGDGGVRMMRDPTRGGVATTLKEMALESGCCITVHESELPVPGGVRGACELLGLDPLFVANEGILIAVVSADAAASLVEKMRSHEYGKNSLVIGEVSADEPTRGMVLLRTKIGGTRIVDMLAGEQLPRIC